MSPCVVFALKLGASVPMRSRGCSVGVARDLRKTGDTAGRRAKEDCGTVLERANWAEVRRALRLMYDAMVEMLERDG